MRSGGEETFCRVEGKGGAVLTAHVIPTPVADALCLALEGELDAFAASVLGPQLRRAAAGRSTVELHAGALDFLDSSGLGMLVQVMQLVHGGGGQFRLVDPSPRVQRVLEITGTQRLLGHDGDGRRG